MLKAKILAATFWIDRINYSKNRVHGAYNVYKYTDMTKKRYRL
jgi:hypothetical protein